MPRTAVFILVAVTMGLVTADRTLAFEDKTAYVNLDRVFTEFYKTKLADKQLKEQAEEFNTDRKTKVEQYEAIRTNFNEAREEAQNTVLSEDVRNQKRTEAEELLVELREKESEIRRFDDSRRKQLEEQGGRMRKRIVNEIREEVVRYAKIQDYTAVIDTSGLSLNGVAVVLYTDPRFNITDAIVSVLNKGREESEEE